MVSSGTVNSDASTLGTMLSNYNETFSAVSSSWQGTSHDMIESKVAEFSNEFASTITGQMNAYANAVQLLEQYIEQKGHYETAVNNYNAAVSNNDANAVNQYRNDADTISNNLTQLAGDINSLLQQASSPKLEATPLKPSSGAANGTFTNYYQYNYDDPYCGGTIADSGCGPTSMAMVLSYLKGEEITPQQMAKEGDGKYTCSEGTVWTYFGDMAQKYGVQCEQMDSTADNLINSLNNGKTCILSMGPGHFTSAGHFIVARGVADNGEIIIADPNSEERSNQTWDVNTVVGEGRAIWALSN